MIELNDVNTFVRPKVKQELDFDYPLSVKLANGARIIAHRRGQSIIQLPDGRVYKT